MLCKRLILSKQNNAVHVIFLSHTVCMTCHAARWTYVLPRYVEKKRMSCNTTFFFDEHISCPRGVVELVLHENVPITTSLNHIKSGLRASTQKPAVTNGRQPNGNWPATARNLGGHLQVDGHSAATSVRRSKTQAATGRQPCGNSATTGRSFTSSWRSPLRGSLL